jgi:hypothetical protein
MVQVGIERKKFLVVPTLPLLFLGYMNLYLACIKAECVVNLVAVCIFLPKSKEPSKLLIGDLIPPSLSHLMELSCAPPFLNV